MFSVKHICSLCVRESNNYDLRPVELFYQHLTCQVDGFNATVIISWCCRQPCYTKIVRHCCDTLSNADLVHRVTYCMLVLLEALNKMQAPKEKEMEINRERELLFELQRHVDLLVLVRKCGAICTAVLRETRGPAGILFPAKKEHFCVSTENEYCCTRIQSDC